MHKNTNYYEKGIYIMGLVFFLIYAIIIISVTKNVIKTIKNGKNGLSWNNRILCIKCKKLISNNLDTCPYCNTVLKKKCPNCGEWVYVGYQHCPSCHNPFDLKQDLQQSTVRRYTSYKSNNTNNTNGVSSYQSTRNTLNTQDEIKCTYHDTYSAGYDPDCKPDESHYFSPKTDYDDIGMVKKTRRKSRTKVQTVDDYMSEMHREGAYHINPHEVKSYDRKGSYGDYEDAVYQDRKRRRKRKKGVSVKTAAIIIFVIIIMFFVGLAVAAGILNGDNDIVDNTNSYATLVEENINYIKIADNETVEASLTSVIATDATDSDKAKLVVKYDDVNGLYQVMLYRCTQNPKATSNYLYYDVEENRFKIEQFLLSSNLDILNKYTAVNGEQYLQIDYFEYTPNSNEQFANNIDAYVNSSAIEVDCQTVSEDLIPQHIKEERQTSSYD